MQTLSLAWLSYHPVAPAAINLVRPVSINSPSTPIPPHTQPQQTWPQSQSQSQSQSQTQYRPGCPGPVFGQTSFGGPSRLAPYDPAVSYDGTMDWEASTYNDYDHHANARQGYDPRPPALRYDTSTTTISAPEAEDDGMQNQWDAFAAGPNGRQRIFPRPHKGEETGLEGLMETWGLRDSHGGERPKRGWGSWFG